MKVVKDPRTYKGSTVTTAMNRYIFGTAVNRELDQIGEEEAHRRVVVIDSDLQFSTGLSVRFWSLSKYVCLLIFRCSISAKPIPKYFTAL